ncbi:UNVERIFIED_ORG: glycosyl transferase family 2 [Martelella mediterranea]
MNNRSFCVTYTIKNEQEIIRDAINAHLNMGASKVFVFFDNTTDGSRDIVRSMGDRVECFETQHPDELGVEVPDWIRDRKVHFYDIMVIRKQINTWRAAKMAEAQGYEWLISIDPDEILYPVGKGQTVADARDFFDSVTDDVDQVLLRNLEVAVTNPDVKDPFRECRYFLRRFPASEEFVRILLGVVSRFLKSPKAAEWIRYYYYAVRFQGNTLRKARHPVTGQIAPNGYFMGYKNFKSAIRVSRVDKFSFAIHKWHPHNKNVPKNIYIGHVLHYDMPNPESVTGKFSQRPNSVFLKNSYSRYIINLVATECSVAEFRIFFKDLCFSESRMKKLLQRGIVQDIDWTSRLLDSSVFTSKG